MGLVRASLIGRGRGTRLAGVREKYCKHSLALILSGEKETNIRLSSGIYVVTTALVFLVRFCQFEFKT